MRKVIKFRPYIFLVCCCAPLFISCNSDELNEDLPNEEVIENITGASFGKYQQLSLDEVTGFVDGIEFNKPLKNGSGMTTLDADSEFLIGLDASSLAFEQVEGAELKIPTVKARLKHPEVKSKIFVVKVKDSTLAFLMNIVEDKSINDEDFSGIIGITDLSGKFVNGYRLKNGEFVSQFVVAKAQQQKDSVGVTKRTLSYTTRTVPKKKWMSGTIQLSEVSVYAPENPSNSGGGSYGGLSIRGGGNYFGGYSFGFSFGGPPSGGGGGSSSSGGSSGSGKGGAINVFPCDDPLHGCDNDFIDDFDDEDDKIINELEGKAECVYDKLQLLSGGFKNMIQKFDGDFPVSHLKFTMTNDLSDDTNAVTSNSGQYTIEIKINANTIEKRTLIGLSRTFAHEVIHAELYRKIRSVGSKVSINDFPGIYDYYRRHKDWQHEQMAAHYIDVISDIISEFDNNNHNRQFYEGIAWEGLHKTSSWNSLSSDERSRILKNIENLKSSGNKICK